LKIGILLGDDIGLEVVPEAVKVAKTAAGKTNLQIDWRPLPIAKMAHDEFGTTFPEITQKTLCELDGWILGPVGHNAYPRNDPTWFFPPIRKKYGLFAALRPSKSFPNIKSVHKNVDLATVREISEGMLYQETVLAGAGEFRPNDEIAVGMRVVTRKGANRVAREAFEYARTRKRKMVTSAHKEPVYKQVCGMFAEECRKVAKDYPDIEYNEGLIDTVASKMAMDPQRYDVIVTTNQFGDILSDIGAGVVGGLGLAPGLCVGYTQAMAQCTHGSAPDIAGKGIANPYAMTISTQMLLGWLGRKHRNEKAIEASDLMLAACEKVIADGRTITADIGGSAKTAQMGDALAEAVMRL
jgi:3-isopropylmalate dehydrogenase